MKKVLKWIGIAFVGLMVLGMIINALKTPEERAAEKAAQEQAATARAERSKAEQGVSERAKDEQEKAKLAAIPSITAKDLVNAYEENTIAADEQYKGKEFKVSGIVGDINTDFLGRPYITLRGSGNEFMKPQFAFEKSAASELAKLKKGAKVVLICTGKGDVAKTPMSDSCKLL